MGQPQDKNSVTKIFRYVKLVIVLVIILIIAYSYIQFINLSKNDENVNNFNQSSNLGIAIEDGKNNNVIDAKNTKQPTESQVSIPVSNTSASAITSPPPSMNGINTHTEVYGTDADPNIITLGPKLGSHPEWPAYAGKRGMEFELGDKTPLLAPIDMMLIGFSDASANYRIQDGQKNTPFNDLMLWFESTSPDWPGMIIFVYHLYSSPLVIGHNQNPDGSEVEEWGSTVQAQGHLFFEFDDYMTQSKGTVGASKALIGYKVKRGELIGFAGSVGTHSMAPFSFKVSDTSINPTVIKGNRYLHWVQPGSFFYWKCYSPDTNFSSGVLAYPFECDGYQLPVELHDINFKYTAKK